MKKCFAFALMMLVAVTVFATGGGERTDSASGEKPTTIKWLIRADEKGDKDAVFVELNKILLEDLNMQLDMQFIAPGNFNQKTQLAMAGGEDWDLIFTSHWANNYVGAAGKGAYLKLDDLLAEHAPDVMAEVPEHLWDGIKVNDGIYALMNYQVMYDQAGLWFLENVVDELGLRGQVESIESWDDYIAILEKVQTAKPEIFPARGNGVMNFSLMFQDPNLSMVLNAPYLCIDPKTKQISNTRFFDGAMEGLEVTREMQQSGLTPPDAATLKDEDTLIRNAMIFSRYARLKPGVEAALKFTSLQDFIVIPTSEGYIDTNAVQSTLTAVNVNSEHPEKAIELYNYFFAAENKEAFNMLIFGLAGTDYEIVNGDRVKKIPDTYAAAAWMLGNQFNAYLLDADIDGVWEDTKQANADANLDILYGFAPDRTSIETELATCEAIWLEYKDILYFGLKDPSEAVAEMMVKLEAAGLEEITAEMQMQVDAFFAAK